MNGKNSKIQAIAFILLEFTLPILFGFIHPALDDGINACFVTWAIYRVIIKQEKQDKGLYQ